MTNKELIASGELELYVAGLLDENRAEEITSIIQTDKEVRKEVESIEKAILRLSEESTTQKDFAFTEILKKVIVTQQQTEEEDEKADYKISKAQKKWISYASWAAAAILLVMFLLQYQTSSELSKNLQISINEQVELKNRINQQNFKLEYKDQLLATITFPSTEVLKLAGQEASPESSAKVFWNKTENKVVIDASRLPSPPEGKVYQVWSLELNPLTPTSLGLLEGISQVDNLFLLDNPNSSEAFGITLKPEGGSQTPTLEQLYVLGVYDS